ncbi:MAG: hypothetical protein QOK07_960 [Gemmatimonadaceae bacterium]|nr:hypothetical protein [Gemmatimonadaceae bacterium]
MLSSFLVLAILVAGGLYARSMMRDKEEQQPRTGMTEDQIKQKWRELGFFCELDDQKRTWTLTGSRAGLLYFPDLLLGYVNDPANAIDGTHKHYGPYGSLEVVTWPQAGFDSQAIRGSLAALTHLAELVEVKLASAEPGSPIPIREEFAPDSRYTLLLDVRADGFDPASVDSEHLGATVKEHPKEPPK